MRERESERVCESVSVVCARACVLALDINRRAHTRDIAPLPSNRFRAQHLNVSPEAFPGVPDHEGYDVVRHLVFVPLVSGDLSQGSLFIRAGRPSRS